jgi:hypothetical protein
MNNNPLFLFIQRFTRFDTGIKNMTSNISKSLKKETFTKGRLDCYARDMWRSVVRGNFREVVSLLTTCRKEKQSRIRDERKGTGRVDV